MILIHSRPTGISEALSGTGASFLTSADALTDGKPQRTTRIQWLSAGSPATSDVLALQRTWGTAKVLRGACLRNLIRGIGGGSPVEYDVSAFPAGVRVEIRGKRSGDAGFTYALGGNSTTQDTVLRDTGEACVHWLFDEGLDAVIGVEIRIYNDASSSTFLSADDYIEIGEAMLGTGAEWPIRNDLGDSRVDPTLWMESVGQQQFPLARASYLEQTYSITAQSWDRAYGDADCLSVLRTQLAGGGDVLVYPQLREAGQGAGAAVDYDVVNQHAVFGKVRDLGRIQAASGAHAWTMAIRVRESPA